MPRDPPQSHDELSDDELMLLVARGLEAAFEELVRRHHPVVLGYATRFWGDRDLAREVTQEVFLTAWSERKRYSPRGKLRGYLLAVAYNRCQAAARKRRRAATPTEVDEPEPRDEGLMEDLLEAERVTHPHRQLLLLNEPTRRVILSRFMAELSYEEISAATGQRIGTLKSQVCRGLKQLFNMLSEEHRA